MKHIFREKKERRKWLLGCVVAIFVSVLILTVITLLLIYVEDVNLRRQLGTAIILLLLSPEFRLNIPSFNSTPTIPLSPSLTSSRPIL